MLVTKKGEEISSVINLCNNKRNDVMWALKIDLVNRLGKKRGGETRQTKKQ